jgi:hypothetical protein
VKQFNTLRIILDFINTCFVISNYEFINLKRLTIIHCRSGGLLNQFLNFFQIQFVKKSLITNDKILVSITIIILLAYPVNHIIRWLIGKSKDKTLPELIYHFSDENDEPESADNLVASVLY